MAIASLSGVSYWYPGRREAALSRVSVELARGLTVVAGPSGGGKSTLLRCLNGLVPHFHGGRIAGSMEVDGMAVIVTPTRRLARSVGFVFQDPELQTVYDVVEREVGFGLENIGAPRGEVRAWVEQAMTDAGVEHLAGRRVRTLSGGERQRVALASALAMRPRIVVLDEPTSQLDPDGAAMLLAAALRIARDGRAVVVSEHRLESLVPSATQMLQVTHGRAHVVDPSTWTAPQPPPRSPRPGEVGPQSWRLRNVTAGFEGHVVASSVDVHGCRGEVIALTGPNGGGKTTLLRVIAGGLTPLAGDVERGPGRVAYLPQNPTALLHRPTVRSEVELTLRRAGEPEGLEAILAELGLTEVAGRYPRDLSTGERQRAALAAVLAGRPQLVLLDEPTRGMDLTARDGLIRVIARLRDQGAAVVLATHDRALIDSVADRTFEVGRGSVRPLEPPQATAR